jgi:hypothetical protein
MPRNMLRLDCVRPRASNRQIFRPGDGKPLVEKFHYGLVPLIPKRLRRESATLAVFGDLCAAGLSGLSASLRSRHKLEHLFFA